MWVADIHGTGQVRYLFGYLLDCQPSERTVAFRLHPMQAGQEVGEVIWRP